MATQIKNGQFVTLSATEVAYEIVGFQEKPLVLTFTLVSGTAQVTTAAVAAAPVLDTTYATWSTAGDKWVISINPATSTLRMKCASAGVVNVFW